MVATAVNYTHCIPPKGATITLAKRYYERRLISGEYVAYASIQACLIYTAKQPESRRPKNNHATFMEPNTTPAIHPHHPKQSPNKARMTLNEALVLVWGLGDMVILVSVILSALLKVNVLMCFSGPPNLESQ